MQAPDKESLDKLVRSAKKFANSHQMDNFKVLEKGKDPDGGYRAIVTAHNWNPITWIKEKIAGRKARPAVEGEAPKLGDVAEETRSEKEREEGQKRWRKDQERYAKAEGERTDEEEEARFKAQEEEFLRRNIPPSQRKRARKRMKEAEGSVTEASMEILGQGVPEKITQYYKTLQKEHWTDKITGQPIPEPRTAEERAQADFHPSQWTFLPVEKKLSRPEQLAIARTLELEGMEVEIARGKYKQYKREQSPVYRAAKAAGGFGTLMAGAVTMGVASGAGRAGRGSRVGPERAMRMHAPGVPMDLYAVRPMLGVGIPPARVHTGAGLGHLRELTLLGVRRPRRQVAQVRRTIEQEQ